jgi:hypothetical protein
MRHPVYTTFGVILLLLLATAELRGWSLLRPTEVKNSPHSIRDNPGAYRPHYHIFGTGRSLGGK